MDDNIQCMMITVVLLSTVVYLLTAMVFTVNELNEYDIQWVPQLFEQLEFFLVNKSCKIECCDKKTHQILENMILSRGLELEVSLL